jgi:cytochrome c-type biogenesis protein CcmH/NrfF
MRRHDFDALSFVFGLAFAGVGLVLLGGGVPLAGGLALVWTGPVVAIGLAVLIVVAARPRSASTATDADVDEPTA